MDFRTATSTPQLVLILAVAAVGVLHTIVPDHWLPIALVSRRHGWTRGQTSLAALTAGTGHVVSTLVIGLAVWFAGIAFAARFGRALDLVSSIALIGFGVWIAIGSFVEQRRAHDDHAHGQSHFHRHLHRHEGGPVHVHLHAHGETDAHDAAFEVEGGAPNHEHEHMPSGRTALLLILGSSPMVEGIPAFFAASPYGAGLIAIMAVVFAAATIATYMALCVYFADRLHEISIGPLETYGETFSGGFIALVGLVFLLWPAL